LNTSSATVNKLRFTNSEYVKGLSPFPFTLTPMLLAQTVDAL